MGEVANILGRAAELIEPEGAWTKGTLADPSPLGGTNTGMALCMVSAVMVASGVRRWVDVPQCGDIGITLYQVTGSDGFPDGLMRWNDAPERTQSEVVAKLREAAALAREQGK